MHPATHALMGSAERPYDASLAVTQPEKPTPKDIGFLRLEDLMSNWGGKLKDCELVVLSACNTQHGVRQGDTMMSLPLGFFFAGTSTVVASLWKVDDAATQLLMTRFYENLLGQFDSPRSVDGRTYSARQPLPNLAALREAKQWLRTLPAADVRRLLKLTDEKDWLAFKRRYREVGEVIVTTPPTQPRIVADDEQLFSHPHYWAAFILIGDPG